jgi:hypothetical protein
MQCVLLLLVACLLPFSGLSQTRTWTFAQDGKMVNDVGDTWTFKKNGRMDAAFVRLDGTNAILRTADASYRTVALICLSPADRSYLRKGGVVSEQEAAKIAQAVAVQNAASKRALEVSRMKNEAAARRRLAQLALDSAERLDNEAVFLSTNRVGGFEAHVGSPDATADRSEKSRDPLAGSGKTDVPANGDTTNNVPAAGSLENELARIKNLAAEKRRNAAKLQKEAADLENAAHSMEAVPASHQNDTEM